MRTTAETICLEMALRLGCIEMRRFFKNMAPEALLKKTNMDYIERVCCYNSCITWKLNHL